jgi:hypothetical protein
MKTDAVPFVVCWMLSTAKKTSIQHAWELF